MYSKWGETKLMIITVITPWQMWTKLYFSIILDPTSKNSSIPILHPSVPLSKTLIFPLPFDVLMFRISDKYQFPPQHSSLDSCHFILWNPMLIPQYILPHTQSLGIVYKFLSVSTNMYFYLRKLCFTCKMTSKVFSNNKNCQYNLIKLTPSFICC